MKEVAIVAQQRTGSTLLSKCLDSHSLVWSLAIELYLRRTSGAFLIGLGQSAEVLNDFYTVGRLRYDLMRGRPRSVRTCTDSDPEERSRPIRVAKIMHNQMLATPRLDRYVIKNTRIRIIHLRRENLLKQHVSNMLNKQREAHRRPAQATESVSVARIRVNPTYAMLRMRVAKMLYQWYDRRLSQHPKIELVYERMVGTNGLSEPAAEMVCEFLGIPPEPLRTDLVKLNPDNLSQIVTNYGELVHALTGTEFEQYLD